MTAWINIIFFCNVKGICPVGKVSGLCDPTNIFPLWLIHSRCLFGPLQIAYLLAELITLGQSTLYVEKVTSLVYEGKRVAKLESM